MSLGFVLGGAGSGKTWYCLNEIKKELQQGKKQLYFLVPAQATFIHEKMLADDIGLGGFFDAEIIGFGRLACHAREFLHEKQQPILNETGKVMLISKLLAEHKEELRAFASSCERIGFAEGVQELFDEFKSCKLDIGDVDAAFAEKGKGNFSDKLHDIILLYRLFLQETEGKYKDENDNLHLLTRAINQGFLKNAHIFIDGYASFDPVELEVLSALFANQCFVQIALPITKKMTEMQLAEEHYLYKIWELYHQLLTLAQNINCPLMPTVEIIGDYGRFSANPELDFLNKNLFPLSKCDFWQAKPQHIHIHAAADKREELSGVGRHILRLVRDCGYKFSDISICARHIEEYEDELMQVFSDFGIPYFTDGKKPMLNHPLIELIRAAIEVASEKAKYRHIFRYLKNSFSPLSLLEVSALENYCLMNGIRFYHWKSKDAWKYCARSLGDRSDHANDESDLAAINAARFKGTAELWRFCDSFSGDRTVRERLQAIYTLMEDLQVQKKLDKLYQTALAEGRVEEAELHKQAVKNIFALFEQADQLLAEVRLPLSVVVQVLDGGFSALKTAMIPPAADQVFVASIDRSRTPKVKTTFVLGLNEGVFPAKISSGGILNGRDRELLQQKGFELAPSAVKRQFAEYYLLYIALTRASEQLYMSFVLTNADDQTLLPSMAIHRVLTLFPQLKEENYSCLPLCRETGGNATLANLAVNLRRQSMGKLTAPYWMEFLRQYEQLPKYQNNLMRLKDGLYFQSGPIALQPESIKRLFGTNLYSSVSRLETFIKCPLAYFASYSLKLKKRPEYKLSAPDIGSLFHAVMEDMCKEIAAQKIDWHMIDEPLAALLVKNSAQKFLPYLLGNILKSSARFKYIEERFLLTLSNALLIMAQHMQKGEFKQIGWEISFGPKGILPTFDIVLENDCILRLSGCIDRLDAAVSGDKVWFRVIDYKSSDKDLSVKDVYNGLSLQLLLYLQVAQLNAKKLGFDQNPHVAGGFYFSFRDSFITLQQNDAGYDPFTVKMTGLPVQDNEAVQLSEKLVAGSSSVIPVRLNKDGSFAANSGGVSEEEMDLLQKHLIYILEQSAMHLYDGVIEALPSTGSGSNCTYCDFKAFCGFEFDLAVGKTSADNCDNKHIFEKLREEHGNDK